MNISVIIPCYNEEDRLSPTLGKIAAFHQQYPDLLKEIIIVDDGSIDATLHMAEKWKHVLPLCIFSNEQNRGKGAALRTGVQAASGDYTLLFDADSATSIEELMKFTAELTRSSANILIGCRVPKNAVGVTVKMAPYRRFIGRVYHAMTIPLIPGIRDAACGFKLLETKKAKELFATQRINRFAYDIEILAAALHRNWRVVEVPVNWSAVPISKVNIIRDGIEMFLRVFQIYTWKILGKGIFQESSSR